jgi:uncharacterized lipoprotein YddW (UPF0748 family)
VNIKTILLSGLLAIASSVAIPTIATAVPAQNQKIKLSSQNIIPPRVPREFRGAWIATVLNIDWPSRSGLTTQQQKTELLAILDRAVALKLNAVVFQIRPAAYALYNSPYDPWSESITGQAHWILDCTFAEDSCRIRSWNSPRNFALLRRIALNALSREQTYKRSFRQK